MTANLREALEWVDQGEAPMPGSSLAVIVAAARAHLHLAETAPDYEAAHRYGDRYGISPEDVNGIVDAALADYLTEEV